MRQRILYLTIAVVAIEWMVGGFAAQAGFVAASISAGDEYAMLAGSASVTNSMAGTESVKSAPSRAELLEHPLPGAPVFQEAAGSMTPSPSTGTSVAPATTVSEFPVPSPANLQVRMACMEEPFHPRFIKSRLFRPPRR